MLATPFRPSDDATVFPLNIPVNAFISVELKKMALLMKKLNEVTRKEEPFCVLWSTSCKGSPDGRVHCFVDEDPTRNFDAWRFGVVGSFWF
mgnify:CR=1 FL=1